jgi:hypothetical protein
MQIVRPPGTIAMARRYEDPGVRPVIAAAAGQRMPGGSPLPGPVLAALAGAATCANYTLPAYRSSILAICWRTMAGSTGFQSASSIVVA